MSLLVSKDNNDPVRAALLAKYNPLLYFDNPIESVWNSEPWRVIATQAAEFDEDAFWDVVKKLTTEINLVIPPIESVEIVCEDEDDHVEIREGNIRPDFVILRRLMPKRKDKDRPLLEKVEYFYNVDGISRVVYTPLLEDAQELPFYYPKARALSYVYADKENFNTRADPNGNLHPVLRLELLPLESSSLLLTAKLRVALSGTLHTFYKWCASAATGGYVKRVHHDLLVPKDRFVLTYARLKESHGKEWVRKWPEKTDPRKFVYEDVAIATFLLELWKMEREITGHRRQKFVDLGCGNGLLTHILTQEGHDGFGIDIAKRKVWDMYGDKTKVLVETLDPRIALYPDADWLIGNHADELVPWIPIIASRSSPTCRFVIIPCCYHTLSGARYKFGPTPEGKYRAYVNHIRWIAEQCGFRELEEERLRIPSTKDTAIVGRHREDEDMNERDQRIEKIIAEAGTFLARVSDREKELLRRKKIEMKNVPSPPCNEVYECIGKETE